MNQEEMARLILAHYGGLISKARYVAKGIIELGYRKPLNIIEHNIRV